jgi:hypothetical protein
VHSFETTFYVLAGEPTLYLEDAGRPAEARGVRRHPGGGATRLACRRGGAWDRDGVAATARRGAAADTFFLGPPRTRNRPTWTCATRATATFSGSEPATWTSTG